MDHKDQMEVLPEAVKNGFAAYYHLKLLLVFRKHRKRYFLYNKTTPGADAPGTVVLLYIAVSS